MATYENGVLGLNNLYAKGNYSKGGILSKNGASLPRVCSIYDTQKTVRVTHVVVMFSGWNPPWQDGGRSIPTDDGSTLNAMKKNIISKVNSSINSKFTLYETHSIAIEAYATDTDDDAKDLAIAFIKNNHSNRGKIIIYGYSWGGDTAVELSIDLKGEKNIDLLVTIDAALGIFNGPAVRDRNIPNNVRKNINHYTTTPKSRVGSQGLTHYADESDKTLVENIKHTGPTHGQMDEKTSEQAVGYIANEIIYSIPSRR